MCDYVTNMYWRYKPLTSIAVHFKLIQVTFLHLHNSQMKSFASLHASLVFICSHICFHLSCFLSIITISLIVCLIGSSCTLCTLSTAISTLQAKCLLDCQKTSEAPLSKPSRRPFKSVCLCDSLCLVPLCDGRLWVSLALDVDRQHFAQTSV